MDNQEDTFHLYGYNLYKSFFIKHTNFLALSKSFFSIASISFLFSGVLAVCDEEEEEEVEEEV